MSPLTRLGLGHWEFYKDFTPAALQSNPLGILLWRRSVTHYALQRVCGETHSLQKTELTHIVSHQNETSHEPSMRENG